MSNKLDGMNILVAEDSFHIAFVIETALESEGATVIGPAATLDRAQKLADSTRPDFAVVDMRLGDEEAVPLIRQLVDTGIAVLVATGNELDSEFRAEFPGVPILRKPYTTDRLVDLIRDSRKSAS
ncbi:MAG: response regulator [Hyphomicrobiales bacterium]